MATDSPPLWNWSRPAQATLAGIAAALALVLLALAPAASERPKPDEQAPAFVLDLNTAPEAALVALPAIGPALAGRIVAARQDRPFDSLDDFDRRVKGIGPKTIEKLRPYVRIGEPATSKVDD